MSAFFDEYRDSYEDEVNRALSFSGLRVDFFTKTKARLLRRLLEESFAGNHRPRVLDIGCGPASIHPLIAPCVEKLIGIDVSLEQLGKARAENPEGQYLAYDGKSLPFADGSFDAVFTICVLHHVPPARWGRFAAEMRRVTSRDGLAVVFEHNPLNLLTRIVVNRCPFDKDAVLLRSRTVAGLLQRAGFSRLSQRFFLFSPFQNKLFKVLDQALGRVPFGAQYYVAARNR